MREDRREGDEGRDERRRAMMGEGERRGGDESVVIRRYGRRNGEQRVRTDESASARGRTKLRSIPARASFSNSCGESE